MKAHDSYCSNKVTIWVRLYKERHGFGLQRSRVNFNHFVSAAAYLLSAGIRRTERIYPDSWNWTFQLASWKNQRAHNHNADRR